MTTTQPTAQLLPPPETNSGPAPAPHVKKIKAMLRAILKHKPYAAPTGVPQAEAWNRVGLDLWKGGRPAFKVQTVFSMLMAHPAEGQHEFQGWDDAMYQLRAHLAEETARFSTQAPKDERAAPHRSELGETRADRDRVRDENTPVPGPSSLSGEEPNPKRIRIRRHTMEAVQADESEVVGEVSGAADHVNDVKLVDAITSAKPHATSGSADAAAAWDRVVTQLEENGYERKLTVKALKRQFGLVLNALSFQPDHDAHNAELARTLSDYCGSAHRLSPAMERFLRRSSNRAAEPAINRPKRPARAQREQQAQDVAPAEAAPASRGCAPERQGPSSRRTTTRPAAVPQATPVAREPTREPSLDVQVKLSILDNLKERARLQSEETMRLMSILGDSHHVRDGTDDVER